MSEKEYKFVKDKPVAKFYYKGQHKCPIKRTIIIVEVKENIITGYELREGSIVRSYKNAPIKSYRRSSIAKANEIDRRKSKDYKDLNSSTFKRMSLRELVKFGV